jgi:tellurite resistance protein TerC
VIVLTITTVASLIKSKKDPEKKAHAGSLRNHPNKDESAQH